MTQNSNIRRIDELGRIVIPKDIRKKLHIKNSEPLEIYIENDEIRIKKYSALPDAMEYISYLLDTGSRTTGNKYLLTTREEVLTATEKELIGHNLTEELKESIPTCTEEKNKYVELKFDDISLKAHINMLPIIIDGDRTGLIIEYNVERELHGNEILKIFANLIEKELNNY